MAPTRNLRRPFAALLAAALLAPALAGCQSTADSTGSVYPVQFRDRHPIVIADKPRVLDVFVEGGGIGARQQRDVAAFGAEYRRVSGGTIVAQVPAGPGSSAGTPRALEEIRSLLGARMSVSRYRPADPTVASPIRLTFRSLQAGIATRCGLWPEDLGVDGYATNMSNTQYWNFGCATQANFAAQVADPVDLVRGREASPPDTIKRMHSFDQLRQGQDPSTTYKQEAATTH